MRTLNEKDVEAMCEQEALARLLDERNNGTPIRNVINRRILRAKKPSVFWQIRNWESYAKDYKPDDHDDDNGHDKHRSKQQRPRRQSDQSWTTDNEMLDDDYNTVRLTLRDDAFEYWDGTKLQKTPEEIVDFLDSLERYESFDELTERQLSLLGMCRRHHDKWMRSKK
jgi:hypothetical protein